MPLGLRGLAEKHKSGKWNVDGAFLEFSSAVKKLQLGMRMSSLAGADPFGLRELRWIQEDDYLDHPLTLVPIVPQISSRISACHHPHRSPLHSTATLKSTTTPQHHPNPNPNPSLNPEPQNPRTLPPRRNGTPPPRHGFGSDDGGTGGEDVT
jgi:hypothetical protein